MYTKARRAPIFLVSATALTLLLFPAPALKSQLPSNPSTAAKSGSQPSLAAANHLANVGQGSEALQMLDELAAATPNLPGLDRTRGTALYGLERLKEADAAFAKALTLDPHDQEAAQMRGLTLYRLGRSAEAIPLLESSPGTGVQSKADPSYVLALCYVDARRYDDARRAFAAQFGVATESADAYLISARMLLRREHLPVALKFATRAVELNPNLPLANELLGEIALAANHFDEAISFFEKERMRNPAEAIVYERLGDAFSRAARYPEARRVLQEAVLLGPNSTGPYILLGKVTLKQNDPIAALTYLERAERMDPSNYMTHSLLAQTYRAVGRTGDATKEQEIAEKAQSGSMPKLNSLQ